MISVLHASTTASLSTAILEQARHSTHDTARHVTTRTTRRACRVVTEQVEFGLYKAVQLFSRQRVAMLCTRKGDHNSGVTPAMDHRRQYIHLQTQTKMMSN